MISEAACVVSLSLSLSLSLCAFLCIQATCRVKCYSNLWTGLLMCRTRPLRRRHGTENKQNVCVCLCKFVTFLCIWVSVLTGHSPLRRFSFTGLWLFLNPFLYTKKPHTHTHTHIFTTVHILQLFFVKRSARGELRSGKRSCLALKIVCRSTATL